MRYHILFRRGTIGTEIECRDICQMDQSLFPRAAIVFSQIGILIPQHCNPKFQLAQVFIARYPEMGNLSIVVKIYFQLQFSVKQCDYTVPLPDTQHIPVIIPAIGNFKFSLVIFFINSRPDRLPEHKKTFDRIIHLIDQTKILFCRIRCTLFGQ